MSEKRISPYDTEALQAERDAYEQWRSEGYIRKLEAQRDELVALVERVEFVGGEPHCPWCKQRFAHAPDCERQEKLAKAKGE